jgi:hypothetical protein
MTAQLQIPMPRQRQAGTRLHVWQAVVSLRRMGFRVYRVGYLHKVVLAADGRQRHGAGPLLSSRQLLELDAFHGSPE